MVDQTDPQPFIFLRQPHSLLPSDLSEVSSCTLFPVLRNRLFTTTNSAGRSEAIAYPISRMASSRSAFVT